MGDKVVCSDALAIFISDAGHALDGPLKTQRYQCMIVHGDVLALVPSEILVQLWGGVARGPSGVLGRDSPPGLVISPWARCNTTHGLSTTRLKRPALGQRSIQVGTWSSSE
jgi:hypothetical protein